MEFKLWIESQIIDLPISDIVINRKALMQAFHDWQQGRESRTHGPIHVWQRADNKYQLEDGYHRIIHAIINDQPIMRAEVVGRGDSYIGIITHPQNQFKYSPSMTYQDLQRMYDNELLDDLGL